MTYHQFTSVKFLLLFGFRYEDEEVAGKYCAAPGEYVRVSIANVPVAAAGE